MLVAPGASTAERLWPAQNFAACADALAEKFGGTVFLIGSPRESDLIAQTHALCRNQATVIAAPAMGFDLVMGLMSESLFLLGNDSGPANVMAALGKTSFALCGTSVPPIHSPHQRLIEPDSPHRANGMQGITVAQVLEKIYAEVSV